MMQCSKKRMVALLVAGLLTVGIFTGCEGTSGPQGEKGDTGGAPGVNGLTPMIGENGNRWIGDTDTGVKAIGTDGAQGPQGEKGETGAQGSQGEKGETGADGQDGIGIADIWVIEEPQEFMSNGDGTCSVSGIRTCKDSYLVIPRVSPSGDSVTSIVDSTFGWGDDGFASGCTSVTIPDSVTSIGYYAFGDCLRLTSVTIPNSVTSIGYYAFGDCRSLTSVTIPDSVTSIGVGAFSNCDNLIEISVKDHNPVYHSAGNCIIETESGRLIAGCSASLIPNDGSVTSIGDYAFKDCRSLTSVTIPNSVTSIGDYAFDDCRSLTSVTIPNSVTSIGDYAFSDCGGLTSVTIPNSVTSIGVGTFSNCANLMEISVKDHNPVYHSAGNCIIETDSGRLIAGCSASLIPNDGSVTSIGDYAFYGCDGLTSVTIPNSVTSIGDSAFIWCDGLTSVTIPTSVTSIGDYAFGFCDGLTSVTIPNSVTSIGYSAFKGCRSLTSVTFNGTISRWNAIYMDGWNGYTPDYTITCTDGIIEKS